jgi:GH25 family lysozyme M1 (1,4-beta-N-acetylmuramidase)
MFMKRVTELWYPNNYKALMPMATDEDKFMYRLPGVYTYPWYAASHQPNLGNSKELAKYWLHLAAYKTKNGKLCPWLPDDGSDPFKSIGQRTPKPWDKVTVWQYSGNSGLKTPGIAADCDRDVFLGSHADWDKFRGVYRPTDLITGSVL